MRAIQMRSFGVAEVLELVDLREPRPGPDEALVRVGAVEVSRTRDIATRTGRHPFSRQVTLPHVLGGDFAGVVEAVGAGVDPELVGRRVAAANSQGCGTCPACRAGREEACPQLVMLGVHRPGSYAELTTVPVANLHPIPDELSMAEAAALAADGPIAFTQLEVGEVQAGTWLLVTGATGALATTLIAMAAARGARVVGLSRRPGEIPAGLDLAARLDVNDADLGASLAQLTGGAGVEVAIDNVADPKTFALYFGSLNSYGRVVVSGAIGTDALPVLQVPAAALYMRSLSLIGIRTASRARARRFWAAVADGFRLPGGLMRTLPLDAAVDAHREIEAGQGVGHLVLTVR